MEAPGGFLTLKTQPLEYKGHEGERPREKRAWLRRRRHERGNAEVLVERPTGCQSTLDQDVDRSNAVSKRIW